MKEEKRTKEHRSYEVDFKLQVLKDMYEHGLSYCFTCRKYGILSPRTLHLWEKAFPLDTKSLSLSEATIKKVKSMRKKATNPVKKTREESLEEEISNLRAALSYSELRNEALHEVLKIGKEKYGIDLLKKAGAKQ
jgi:transposase-like protein